MSEASVGALTPLRYLKLGALIFVSSLVAQIIAHAVLNIVVSLMLASSVGVPVTVYWPIFLLAVPGCLLFSLVAPGAVGRLWRWWHWNILGAVTFLGGTSLISSARFIPLAPGADSIGAAWLRGGYFELLSLPAVVFAFLGTAVLAHWIEWRIGRTRD